MLLSKLASHKRIKKDSNTQVALCSHPHNVLTQRMPAKIRAKQTATATPYFLLSGHRTDTRLSLNA